MNTQITEWFNEALNHPDTKSITTPTGDKHLIHRGFKLSKIGTEHQILDVRTQDFYSPITKSDASILKSLGFIIGAGYLMYLRDCKRVILFQKSINKLELMLARFETMLSNGESVEFAKKRIRNCKDNLSVRRELIIYYTERRDRLQKKFKFNINGKA